MIKRETELIEEINSLKSELKARDDIKIIHPPPDPTLQVTITSLTYFQHQYDILQSEYEKLEEQYTLLKRDFDIIDREKYFIIVGDWFQEFVTEEI